jgi:hypothetical protein
MGIGATCGWVTVGAGGAGDGTCSTGVDGVACNNPGVEAREPTSVNDIGVGVIGAGVAGADPIGATLFLDIDRSKRPC